MRSLTRRSLLVACSIPAAWLVTSCANSESNVSSPQSGVRRKVLDIDGAEVEVPENPQRIVALSEPTLDAVLALGLTPVGITSGRGQSTAPSYLLDQAKDIPILGSVSELNYEAIGAANPDIILVDGTSVNNRPDVLEILRAIGPVVFCGYAGGPWEANFDTVCEALGKQDYGTQLKQEHEQKLRRVGSKLSEKYPDQTYSIVRWQGSGPSLILKELPAGQVLEGLGMKRPSKQDRLGRGHSEPVSLENLADIDADCMFLGTLGGASRDNPTSEDSADVTGAEEALKKAEETSGFKNLKAYQNNRIILVDGSKWTSTGGPLLMRGIVEDIDKALLS